jgi:transcription factor C subunit 7
VDTTYSSTFYPSREGETLKQLQDRADAFIEAWTARVEEMGVRSVVLFGHAASVIAIGRAVRR